MSDSLRSSRRGGTRPGLGGITLNRRTFGLGAAGVLFLTACGTTPAGQPTDAGTSDVDPDADVAITVGGLPTTERAESRQLMLDQVDAFMAAHPHITVEAVETVWHPATFNAMLEGGTLPDVLGVAFTDVQGVIARGQMADITDFVADDPVVTGLNEQLLQVARSPEGRLYGIPTGAYSFSLIYNRRLFSEAGLDPDSPPATWEEVAEAAQKIKDATGVGFALGSMDNTGGWILTAMSYAFGGLMQGDVDGTTQAIFADTGATSAALSWMRDLRWDRGIWLDETLLGGDDLNNAFAAGTLSMWTGPAGVYNDMVSNRGMDPEEVGIGPMPMAPEALGVLGGGTVHMISPKADANQIAAAVEWIKFYSLSKFIDQEAAVADASSRSADGLPVGAPELPIVGTEQYDQYLSWIEEYIDVPRVNFTGYLESTKTVEIVAEPAVEAQVLYASLDSVIQAVLTDEAADVDDLLASTQEQFNTQISAG